jgi:hypothetical protein
MSEIRVTTLKDTGGGNSSTANEIYEGRAKAWVNWNGVGTVAIRDDFNVNTVSDDGTGDFTVNFSTSLGNTNYSVTGMVGEDQDNGGNRMIGIRLATATNCGFMGFTYNGGSTDLPRMCASFYAS